MIFSTALALVSNSKRAANVMEDGLKDRVMGIVMNDPLIKGIINEGSETTQIEHRQPDGS